MQETAPLVLYPNGVVILIVRADGQHHLGIVQSGEYVRLMQSVRSSLRVLPEMAAALSMSLSISFGKRMEMTADSSVYLLGIIFSFGSSTYNTS